MMQETIRLCDDNLGTVKEQVLTHNGSKSDRAYYLAKALHNWQGPILFEKSEGDWVSIRPDDVGIPKKNLQNAHA